MKIESEEPGLREITAIKDMNNKPLQITVKISDKIKIKKDTI